MITSTYLYFGEICDILGITNFHVHGFWKHSQSQVDTDMEYWKSQVLRSIKILTDPSHSIMRWVILICNNYDFEQAET